MVKWIHSSHFECYSCSSFPFLLRISLAPVVPFQHLRLFFILFSFLLLLLLLLCVRVRKSTCCNRNPLMYNASINNIANV